MSRAQQAIILLGLVVTVHLGVLTYASISCVNEVVRRESKKPAGCPELSQSWENSTETYLAVFLAILVPTRSGE